MRRYSDWTHEVAARSNTPTSVTDRVLRELIALAEESGAPMPAAHIACIYGWDHPSDVVYDLRGKTFEWTGPSTDGAPDPTDHLTEFWPMKMTNRHRMIASALRQRKRGRPAFSGPLASGHSHPGHQQEGHVVSRRAMAKKSAEEDTQTWARRASTLAPSVGLEEDEKRPPMPDLGGDKSAPPAPRLTLRELLADLDVPEPDQDEALQLLMQISLADEYASWGEIAQYLFLAMRLWDESPATTTEKPAIEFLREILSETENS